MPGGQDQGQNSWTEYRKLVMDSLETLRDDQKEMKDSLYQEIRDSKENLSNEIKEHKKDADTKFDRVHKRINDFELQTTVDITNLKAKAAMWGGIFGAALGALVSALAQMLLQGKITH